MTASNPPLLMIQLEPDAYRAARWMQSQKVSRPGHDDGYGWHALLMACFGELAPKPFRLIERAGCPLQMLAYTTNTGDQLAEHARSFAEPAAVAALGLGDRTALSCKLMPSEFRVGQRLGFEVRARPTVRQDRDGNRNASREIDAFLAAVQKASPRSNRADLQREEVYCGWLAARFRGAARLDNGGFRIESLRRAMLLRRGRIGGAEDTDGRPLLPVGLLKRGAQGEQGGSPDAVFVGTLTVENPSAFHALLATGLGRHRSFGYGMLLLRPPAKG